MFGFGKRKRQAEASESGTLDQVVPRIKHVDFLKAIEEVAEIAGGATDRPIVTPFMADLLITYAFDLPHTYQMVMTHDLERLKATSQDVSQHGLKNFRDRMPTCEFFTSDDEPTLLGIQTGGHLEACMLLVPEFWTQVAKQLAPADVIAAAPTRDLVVFTSSSSESGINAMRAVIEEAWQCEDTTHNLSKQLFVWNRDQWAVFDDSVAR